MSFQKAWVACDMLPFLPPQATCWSNVSGSASDCRDATDETGFLREEFTAPDVSYGAEFAACLHEEETPWNGTQTLNQVPGSWR